MHGEKSPGAGPRPSSLARTFRAANPYPSAARCASSFAAAKPGSQRGEPGFLTSAATLRRDHPSPGQQGRNDRLLMLLSPGSLNFEGRSLYLITGPVAAQKKRPRHRAGAFVVPVCQRIGITTTSALLPGGGSGSDISAPSGGASGKTGCGAGRCSSTSGTSGIHRGSRRGTCLPRRRGPRNRPR